MESKTIHLILIFIFLIPSQLHSSYAQTWIRAGYWYASGESPIPDINSALFTHLICGFANVSSSSYQLIIPTADQQYYSSFTGIVKRKNPSIITLLSIWNGQASTAQGILGDKVNSSVLSSMLSQSSSRKSFIESSIRTARLYGFWGIDLFWLWPNTPSDMINMGKLLDEWRAAVDSEPRKPSQSRLMLTMAVKYLPAFRSMTYPIESMKRNLDWAHVVAYDYHLPLKENVTANPKDDGIGSPASGLAVTQDGSMSYKYIKWYTRSYEAKILYNASYVVNYCIIGLSWIGFDDVEAIRAKIAYAKEKKLLAQEEESAHGNKRRLLLIIFLPITLIVILIALLVCYLQRELLKTKGKKFLRKLSRSESALNSGSSHLQAFSFSTIKAATNNFSRENQLGEGGFGPVYKGKLRKGQEIAVKRLSKTSTQGLEEFRNEVTLTARLEHVNLVRVLGFCIKKEEKMLIYEYMPNKSLDFYLFDPSTRHLLDWTKRVHIIEGNL
ncbi:hypothetical protein M0R45_003015 [Rubus argutus]|uniref:Uncharacterized protein n=1 Tax=Rubus argutus TaxID=59490 RepID=A0AAW1YHC0_RUBAR